MLTINHEYNVDMVWHYDVLVDYYVLVVIRKRSELGIGNDANQ